jgi:hypothetical protein
VIFDPTPRWKKIGDALSQLGNVGNPFADHTQTTSDESISGRAHREGSWVERPIDWLFLRLTGEVGHCRNSYEADVARARALVAYDETRKRTDDLV